MGVISALYLVICQVASAWLLKNLSTYVSLQVTCETLTSRPECPTTNLFLLTLLPLSLWFLLTNLIELAEVLAMSESKLSIAVAEVFTLFDTDKVFLPFWCCYLYNSTHAQPTPNLDHCRHWETRTRVLYVTSHFSRMQSVLPFSPSFFTESRASMSTHWRSSAHVTTHR